MKQTSSTYVILISIGKIFLDLYTPQQKRERGIESNMIDLIGE